MNLIRKEILENLLPEINREIKESTLNYAIDLNDELFGEAFKFYLLFTHWPSLLCEKSFTIDNELIFYNRYYWFWYLVQLSTIKNGYDAGLEQQAFQLLEESEVLEIDPDWAFIEKIEDDIMDEVQRLFLR